MVGRPEFAQVRKWVQNSVQGGISFLWAENHDSNNGHDGGSKQTGGEQSIRWLAIFFCMTVISYKMAAPLIYRKSTVYLDLRVGLVVWLFLASLLHTPLGSSEVEDHPTLLFTSVFILLLVVTHLTLAAFTVLHHMFAWCLGLCFPRLAETLWVPALRSLRSFKAILKSSIVLSACLSTLFAYCGTVPKESCTMPFHDAKNKRTSDSCANTDMLSHTNKTKLNVIEQFSNAVCVQLLPSLDAYWGREDQNGDFMFDILGFDLGRLSVLNSPIGLLWISGVAIWATYYTLRRTKRINQTLQDRAKRKKRTERMRRRGTSHGSIDEDMEDEDEASDDEYEYDEEMSFLSSASSENSRGLKRASKSPKNFLPMAEWYSLAVTETAFQLLVSMKLFLGRFDMRTMQAAIPEGEYLEGFSDEEEPNEGYDTDYMEDYDSYDGYETASGHNRGLRSLSTPRRGKSWKNRTSKKPSYDSRYADLDELWFDWMADTGDGGNPTYAVARTLAQPELSLAAFKKKPNSQDSTAKKIVSSVKKKITQATKGGDEGPVKLETLKRGDLLIIGGDLAYPTPSRKTYDQRLFVPFEAAMESPPSYHRDDISTLQLEEGSTISSRLSFVRAGPSDAAASPATCYSLPLKRKVLSDLPTLGRGRARKGSKTRNKNSRIGESISKHSDLSNDGSIFQIGGSSNSLASTASSPVSSDSYDEQNQKKQGEQDDEDACTNGGLSNTPRKWSGPPCVFAMPGNHDWFDGLDTYMQCICYRDWLGGWRMPQKKSYFALKLPHGWWFFGLDFALEDDIDGLQFQYFAFIVSKYVGPDDQIILGTHEPTWILDAYLNYPHPQDEPVSKSSCNLKQLMRRHLRGRVALRIAGDIHNYMRDDAVQPLAPSGMRAGAAPVLVVSGGGGAFLHPTHSFPEQYKETGAQYQRKAAYPKASVSRGIGRQNLGQGFRLQNWRFDIVGATAYFLMVVSFFPRCQLDHIINSPNFYPEGLSAFFFEVGAIFVELWTDSVVSMIVAILAFLSCYSFADWHYGKWRQLSMGTCHASVHVICAIVLFLLLEIVVEVSISDGLAGKGYDSFFNSFQDFERRTMPEQWWTSGFLVPILKTLLRVFDMPENMATTRVRICSGQVSRPSVFSSSNFQGHCPNFTMPSVNASEVMFQEGLNRFDILTYYMGNFLFLFVLAADVVGMVLGLYLYISGSLLSLLWNESYSSIRCPDYKNFVRFKIDSSGDLHAYVIGIDRVPRAWREDKRWSSTWTRLFRAHLNGNDEVDELDPDIASYGTRYPSRWIPAYTGNRKHRKEQEPRIVDYFCIPRKRRWLKPRRGNSALDRNASTDTIVADETWWEGFDKLERQRLFQRVSRNQSMSFTGSVASLSPPAVRSRRESKSQSPIGSRVESLS